MRMCGSTPNKVWRHRRGGASEDIDPGAEWNGMVKLTESSEAGHGIGADAAVGEALSREEVRDGES
jgi:hypothetical protein